MKKFAKKLAVFSIALLFLLLTPVTLNPTKALTVIENREVIGTLIAPTEIPLGALPKDLNFTVDYDLSLSIRYDNALGMYLYKGALGYYFETLPTDISISDNLGNNYLPLIENGSLSTPDVNVTIPSNFTYKLTLHFRNADAAQFLTDMSSFELGYSANADALFSTTVILRAPKEYTIVPLVAGAVKTSDNNYQAYIWNYGKGEAVTACISFLPFPTLRTVRTMSVTMEQLTKDPNSGLREVLAMTFDSKSNVSIWHVSLIMPLVISFPNSDKNAQVESVSDGQGECERHTEPLDSTINSLGKYYVDNQKQQVIIYPRSSYTDEVQKFDVTINFLFYNARGEASSPNIPFYEPYKTYSVLSFNFNNLPTLNLDLTGSFTVKLIFPQGYDSFSNADNERFKVISEDGHPAIIFNYNSPTNLPKTEWITLYDDTAFRDYFVQQVANISLLVIALVGIVLVMLLYKKKTKKAWMALVLTLAPVLWMGANLRDFIVLPYHSYPIVIACIGIEVSLSFIIGILFIRFHGEIPSKA